MFRFVKLLIVKMGFIEQIHCTKKGNVIIVYTKNGGTTLSTPRIANITQAPSMLCREKSIESI